MPVKMWQKLCSKQIQLNSTKLFKQFSRHLSQNVRTDPISQEVPPTGSPDTSLTLSHKPVMSREIMGALRPKDGQTFIDMTFGSGGHTKHLLATNKKIRVYALDRDPMAYQRAVVLSKSKLIAANDQQVIPLLGRFSEFPTLMSGEGVAIDSVDGVIIDLGASSMQMDDHRRGFALSRDGPLDMRMDGQRFESMPTAADVVNTLNAEHLSRIFKIYGDERYAMKIAQTIVDSRFMLKRLSSTRELAELVAQVTASHAPSVDRLGRPQHSATRVFQALRIFVNNELNELNYCLQKVRPFLKPIADSSVLADDYDDKPIDGQPIDGGVIAVLSFHSLEDRIVKKHLMGTEMNAPLDSKHFNSLELPDDQEVSRVLTKVWKPINKRVIQPTEDEILFNPRSRSAKLRLAVRVL